MILESLFDGFRLPRSPAIHQDTIPIFLDQMPPTFALDLSQTERLRRLWTGDTVSRYTLSSTDPSGRHSVPRSPIYAPGLRQVRRASLAEPQLAFRWSLLSLISVP